MSLQISGVHPHFRSPGQSTCPSDLTEIITLAPADPIARGPTCPIIQLLTIITKLPEYHFRL
jgi:hypothetical protein